jgi:ABC-2 type transport system permease protein
MTSPSLRDTLRIILVTAEMTLRQTATDLFIIFAVLVQPIIIAVLGLWMLREQAADAAIFVIVGSGLTGLWSSLLFVSGNSITVERWSGTLEHVVAVPTHLGVIVLGKNVANVVQSLVSMVVGYVVAMIFFGYSLSINQPLPFAISVLMTVISFVCFGLLIAPIFIINPGILSLQNGLEFPMYILAGFMFPIALLPNWTTPLSYVLSPYWAARAMHATSSGSAPLTEVAGYWGIMLLLSVVYLVVARVLFRIMLRKARVDATLGME